MTSFITATDARLRSENTTLIREEIAIIELAILSAISDNEFTVNIKHNTTIEINGTTITGSPMTLDDSTGGDYYSVWQGLTTNAVLKAQMDEVISYFEGLKYSITLLVYHFFIS